MKCKFQHPCLICNYSISWPGRMQVIDLSGFCDKDVVAKLLGMYSRVPINQ